MTNTLHIRPVKMVLVQYLSSGQMTFVQCRINVMTLHRRSCNVVSTSHARWVRKQSSTTSVRQSNANSEIPG